MSRRASTVGFYGKLPSHGDFVRRRVSDAFVTIWDAWLQECISASRRALGEEWLDVYLTSPAWRFAFAPGACGSSVVVGVMAPSVDRVGRYFPLTIAAELPDTIGPIAAATSGAAFFGSAERLLIETLAAEPLDFDRFDRQAEALDAALACIGDAASLTLEDASAAILADAGGVRWQVPLGAPAQIGATFEQLIACRLQSLYQPLVMWWTEGSSIVQPSCLLGRGLPHPDSFSALLDGSWTAGRWCTVGAHLESVAIHESEPDHGDRLRFLSAATTHPGRVRSVNQDAFIERPDVGLWAVADGLGGHRDGEVASQMVCDALADLAPHVGFDAAVDAARQRLSEVNEYLVRTASRWPDAATTGSTVVTLLIRGTRCAILWAGDSRVYRYRSGVLEQLTRDHTASGFEPGGENEGCPALTRAVGCQSGLSLDLHLDRVRAGDRFLLCSDGLSRVVPEAGISDGLAREGIRAAVDGLLAATLGAGAPDNVSVLIVDVIPD